jgi:LigXa C-terminal domain like
MIDRGAQKTGRTYSGVACIVMQDASVQESMGPIQDRSKENLVSADNAIIVARIRLRAAAGRPAFLPIGIACGAPCSCFVSVSPSRRSRPTRSPWYAAYIYLTSLS